MNVTVYLGMYVIMVYCFVPPGGMTTELERQFQVHLKDFLVLTQSEGVAPEMQMHFKEFMVNINRYGEEVLPLVNKKKKKDRNASGRS